MKVQMKVRASIVGWLAGALFVAAQGIGLAAPQAGAPQIGAPQVGARPLPDSPDHHGKSLAFNRALGVECVHCHNPPASKAASKPTYLFAQRMMRMVDGLSVGKLREQGGITCWTCHRGRTRPARLPPGKWEALKAEHADVFVGPRAERAQSMSTYAASLGDGCEHCHVNGIWGDDSKPQKGLTFKMISLFEEFPTYFETTRMPQLECFLCHKGKVKPEKAPAP